MNEKIDFVIIWVDGGDPKWLEEKSKYESSRYTDDRTQRYRDWETLRYWFRGVEKFAPWVNRIHFVTWGHLPKWLNTEHSKLHLVKHSDYIPQKYLPTFNSHSIELNLHRISTLTENFVLFNDDTFIISSTRPSDFFKNGLPCESAILNVHCYDGSYLCPSIDIGIINRHFAMRDVIEKNIFKWFNIKYGIKLIRTLALYPCPRFPGMWQAHLPSSLKKSSFVELWKSEFDELDETCMHKFRHLLDCNHWLIKEWQIAHGEFYPRRVNVGKYFGITDSKKTKQIYDYITSSKGKMICVNDEEMTKKEFEFNKIVLNAAFEKILPEKSSFEK